MTTTYSEKSYGTLQRIAILLDLVAFVDFDFIIRLVTLPQCCAVFYDIPKTKSYLPVCVHVSLPNVVVVYPAVFPFIALPAYVLALYSLLWLATIPVKSISVLRTLYLEISI